MHRLRTALSVAAAGGLLAAGGAVAAEPTAPQFAEQRTFFHCAATKVGNAGALSGGLPSWNTTAPTASVQGGGGCGSTNAVGVGGGAGNHAGLYDAVFQGTHKGNIKDITVELHSIYAGAARAGLEFGTGIEVKIDGRDYAPAGVVEVVPVPSSTRASEKVVFTLTGFGVVDRNADGSPKAGPGEALHTVSVKLRHGFLDNNPAGAFVYDTVEVPSGLTFNPAVPADVRAAVG